MKTPALSVILVMALVLAAVPITPALAQEPETEPDALEAAEISAQAAPAATMNYQGYLTDTGGTPLNGNYDMTFSLWTDPAAGVKAWGDESHPGVTVADGQFSVVLGESVPLSPQDDFYQQLYLEVTVNSIVLPRQPLRAVPYAMGIVAGSRANGSVPGAYALYAINTASTGGGGLYADAFGGGKRSIYSADVTHSAEGYSGPDTYIWVPATNAQVLYPYRTFAHVEVMGGGEALIESDSVNQYAWVDIPFQVEIPYGRSYVLRQATVYYKVDDSAHIDSTSIVGRNFATGGDQGFGTNAVAQTSATYASYLVNATTNQTITTTMAPQGIFLITYMANANSTVHLYGARLRLSSNY